MMKQYRRVKAAHPDALLFFRLGDFYEMFFEDAEVASRELEITLTSRTTGAGQRVPMCGVPYHAAENYLSRLVEKGYKVALCDQVEDPRQARGLVRREVVRVVTPGTVLDPSALPEKANNYIVSIAVGPPGTGGPAGPPPGGAGVALDGVAPGTRPVGLAPGARRSYGLASLDFSTGEFRTMEFAGEGARPRLADELSCLEPAEAIVQPAVGEEPELERLMSRVLRRPPVPYREQAFRPAEAARVLLEHFRTNSLEPYGCAEKPLAVAAAGSLLAYLKETGVGSLGHVRALRTESGRGEMVLDGATRRNLELVEPLRGSQRGTLLGILDHTVTSAGARLLRHWLLHPLTDAGAVRRRQEAVAELAGKHLVREELRAELKKVHDLQRLVVRAHAGTAGARDLLALGASLRAVPAIRAELEGLVSGLLGELAARLDPLEDLAGLIERALVDEPPAGLKDGGLIRPGYSREVDELREVSRGGKAWFTELEASERRRTGIKSLKVGYNHVFGYYIEVTRANLASVPAGYERRQTLANAERFVTPELKEREAAVLGAEERLKGLEYELFCDLREKVASETERVQATAAALAALDALLSLSEAGRRYGYCRPEIVDEAGLAIRAGRHPVVERIQTGEEFVPNDCFLGGTAPAFAVITGPNMAGKSTYCRQVALIVLMAQIGSLVPAAEARIGLVDRVFTRIGASDDVSGGRSTFLVEMNETANILNHATSRSLIILDEIGRGTSTYDGLSLAWAVAERIAAEIGALTLFATHYHELTELEAVLPGVANYSIAVREVGDDVVFLRKVARGAVDRSYGIQVARLAGLPAPVIERARDILHQLETGGARRAPAPAGEVTPAGEEATAGHEVAAAGEDAVHGFRAGPQAQRSRDRDRGPGRQLALFETVPSEVEREIADLDLMNLTPIEALSRLHELQERVRKGRG